MEHLALPRNIELERQVTQVVAYGVADPAPLIEFAEARIASHHRKYITDPCMVDGSRDLVQDLKEELADARNYCVWQLTLFPDDPKHPQYLAALSFIIMAFDALS